MESVLMEKNLKKRMLIIVAALLALLVILALTANLLTRCENGDFTNSETTEAKEEIKFSDEYVTDESEFLSDDKYLEYDRTISYFDPQTGITVGLENVDYQDYGECVAFLADLVSAIIAGDAERYNTFFSDLYFETNEPQAAFSMQKLYDISIEQYGSATPTDDGGRDYTYILKYKILNNNGTLRNDMESMSERPLYLIIHEDDAGNFAITTMRAR